MNTKEKALHNAYIQLQVENIIQEPDSQKAAQFAFNLVADINDADIGQKACKALFDRDRAQQKNEAPTLAAAVGNDLLRAQLSGQIEFADSLELDAFARGDLGINGFNQQYHAEASPDYEQKIHQAVGNLVEKHNALSPVAENDPDITAYMAQDFLELCTAEHYSESSMKYLASQKQVILGDQSYNDRLVNAIKSYDKPPNSPKDYVAPEPSEERLNDQREKMSNNWTNNNSALRVVNPAIVSRAQERIPGDPSSKVNIAGNNKNWAMGVQIAQETISKYGNKVLFVPENQVVKRQVADKVFTPQNKEKVAGMHARLNREYLVPALNLIQGSQADQELRAKQMNEVREQAVEQRLAEIRKLAEANGLRLQSLGILDEQQKPKEAKQLSDMAEEASANFDKLQGKAEAAVSDLNAKEATMRAAVYQSQAQVLRSANEFLEVGTPGVDAEKLESVKRAIKNLRDITDAHQAVAQQVQQVRAPLYSESIRQAVTPVLQGQGFTTQEIEVIVSVSVRQLDAVLPEVPTDPEMAAGIAGAMAQNLQSCGSKLSAVDSTCSKIHNAVGQAFNVSIVPQPNGGIFLQPALEGAPYGALSLNEVDASIQEAAAQQGVSLQPDKSLHEQMTPAPILRAGADMTRSYVSPDAQTGQASDTFRVRSQQPLDEAGSLVAFAKNQVSSRISRLKAAAASESQVQVAAAKDCLLLDTVSPLYGRAEEVGAFDDVDDMEDKLALKKEALQGDPSSLISRSVASSSVNKALSMNSLAEEKFGFDENGKAIGVSVGVSGAAILNSDSAELEFLDIDYSQDWVQKGLSDLQVQDYITGQIDRHPGNIFIDPNSKQVKGIDNDLAFPLVDREEMVKAHGIGGTAVSGLPSQIHEDTADKIEALSPTVLREQLESLPKIDGVAPLEPAAIDGAVQRLENLQNHVKDLRQQGLLISQFTPETYEQAKSAQIAAAPNGDIADTAVTCTCQKTSYLGTAIVEQAATHAQGNRKRIKEEDVKPRINEPHATYQKGVNEARANAFANPSSAPTADLANRIAAAKEKVANLEKQLAAQDQDLKAVNNRLNNAEKLGRQQIVAPLRAAYQQASEERKEKLQALKAAKQELDAALDAAVEPQKPALAQKAAEEVLNSKISNQNDLQAKPDQSQVALPKEEVAEEEIKQEDLATEEPKQTLPKQMKPEQIKENIKQRHEEFAAQLAAPQIQNNPRVQQNEAPALEVEGKKSRVASVRDALRGAASRVSDAASSLKTTIGNKLSAKGAEQSLQDVQNVHPLKVTDYKDLQEQLKKLTNEPLKSIELAMNGDVAPLEKTKQNKENLPAKIEVVQQKMAALREEHPGLKQLDRSKVGQVVHSSLRDAAKTAGNRLKS